MNFRIYARAAGIAVIAAMAAPATADAAVRYVLSLIHI